MNTLIITSVFICALTSLSIGNPSDLLKVSLYYEALCPYCQEFITKHLYPGYQKIGSSLIVELVPYGNAKREKVDGHWKIDCQHGPHECSLNRLQACGLSKSTNQDEELEFVNCVETAARDDQDLGPASECAEKIGLNTSVLLQCVNGEEGQSLLLREAEKTEALKPPHRYVPWLVFNGEYDEKTAEEARDDFLKTACALLKNKPSGCPSTEDELIHLSF